MSFTSPDALKLVESFAEIAEKNKDFTRSYDRFGQRLQLGAHEDATNRTRVSELMRYQTSSLEISRPP